MQSEQAIQQFIKALSFHVDLSLSFNFWAETNWYEDIQKNLINILKKLEIALTLESTFTRELQEIKTDIEYLLFLLEKILPCDMMTFNNEAKFNNERANIYFLALVIERKIANLKLVSNNNNDIKNIEVNWRDKFLEEFNNLPHSTLTQCFLEAVLLEYDNERWQIFYLLCKIHSHIRHLEDHPAWRNFTKAVSNAIAPQLDIESFLRNLETFEGEIKTGLSKSKDFEIAVDDKALCKIVSKVIALTIFCYNNGKSVVPKKDSIDVIRQYLFSLFSQQHTLLDKTQELQIFLQELYALFNQSMIKFNPIEEQVIQDCNNNAASTTNLHSPFSSVPLDIVSYLCQPQYLDLLDVINFRAAQGRSLYRNEQVFFQPYLSNENQQLLKAKEKILEKFPGTQIHYKKLTKIIEHLAILKFLDDIKDDAVDTTSLICDYYLMTTEKAQMFCLRALCHHQRKDILLDIYQICFLGKPVDLNYLNLFIAISSKLASSLLFSLMKLYPELYVTEEFMASVKTWNTMDFEQSSLLIERFDDEADTSLLYFIRWCLQTDNVVNHASFLILNRDLLIKSSLPSGQELKFNKEIANFLLQLPEKCLMEDDISDCIKLIWNRLNEHQSRDQDSKLLCNKLQSLRRKVDKYHSATMQSKFQSAFRAQ